MHVSINDVIDSDNEEFFDAISETWSPNNSMKSFEESKKDNDSIQEFEIVQLRNIQFDKLNRREQILNQKISTNNDLQKKVNFSLLFNSSDVINESDASDTVIRQTNTKYQRFLSNKKCRDDLQEMRDLNNFEHEQEDPSFSDHIIQEENRNKTHKITDDLIMEKYFQNSFSIKNSDRKYFTYSPSSKPSNKPSNKLVNNLSESSIDKFNTWPSNSSSLDIIKNNHNFTSHEQNSFKCTPTITKPSESNNSSASPEFEHSPASQPPIICNLSTPDEFINPVDKQIAAIFEMSSNFSMMEQSASDMDNNSFYMNSNDVVSIENEQNGSTNSESESPSHPGNEEFNLSNPKRLSIHSNSSKLDSVSSENRRASFKAKTKEGIRSVFNKFGKAVRSVQNKADEVFHHEKEISDTDSDDVFINEASKTIKYKNARCNKASQDFNKVQIVQILHSNQMNSVSQASSSSVSNNVSNNQLGNQPSTVNETSIIWAMKFSPCGKLLASVGKDQLIRIWVLRGYYENFKDIIKKHNNTPDENSEVNKHSGEEQTPFYSKPLVIFSGHTSDILDVSWSKNLFVLSASSDKTCRLWHIYKSECLCTFHHSSIVSAISFHPKDDRYFISTCLDGKLRLWNIAEKKVVLWNELNTGNKSRNNFITAVSFCQSGKTIAVGTFDGKCILYQTEQLKYYSLINVRSTKGRNSRGSKITGIEVLNNDENKILITSNDSRIRLYDLRDLSLVCKYKGFSNSTVHIRAALSPDDQYIISGSKDKCTYIWKTNHNFSTLNSGRRDRNMYWERIQAHNAIVTCALFAPKPLLIMNNILNKKSTTPTHSDKNIKFNMTRKNSTKDKTKHPDEFDVFVSAAGCDGVIKVFINKLNSS